MQQRDTADSTGGCLEGLRAVIYVLAGIDADRHQRLCVEWCDHRKYRIVALVLDDQTSSRWLDVIKMLAAEEADIVIVYDRDIRPADRLPRVETARHEPPKAGVVPRQRRPRPVRLTRN